MLCTAMGCSRPGRIGIPSGAGETLRCVRHPRAAHRPACPGGGDCGVFAPGGSRLIDAAGTAKRPRTICMLALLAHHPFSGPRLLVPNLGLARVAGCGMLQQGVAGSEVRTVCCQEVVLRLRLPAVHVLCSSQADHAVDLMLKQGQAVRQVA
jgi:hypothetical protein